MPAIGEITKGKEIGKRPPWKQYMWVSCPQCEKERWVQAKRGISDHIRCRECYTKEHNQDNNWNWKGGRTTCMGYTVVKSANHPRAHSRTGYVLEHILVWERVHNQPVPEGAHIHHLNGIKTDNRPRNLVCLSARKHNQAHQTLLHARAERIRTLEAEVALLEKALADAQMIFRLEEN